MTSVCTILDSTNSSNLDNVTVDNECKVCYEMIQPQEESCIAVELLCGHRYHYSCIEFSYQYSDKYRQCPYCRQTGGWLPLLSGMKPKRNIHKEYISLKKRIHRRKKYGISNYLLSKNKQVLTTLTALNSSKEQSTAVCQAIIQSGPKKGNQCSHSTKYGNYCGRHKKFHTILI